jgi:hypothetical protein
MSEETDDHLLAADAGASAAAGAEAASAGAEAIGAGAGAAAGAGGGGGGSVLPQAVRTTRATRDAIRSDLFIFVLRVKFRQECDLGSGAQCSFAQWLVRRKLS